MKKISIIGIQTHTTKDIDANFEQACGLMDEALELHKHSDIVVLPEGFYDSPDNNEIDRIGKYPDRLMDAFSERAKKYKTYIVGGSVYNRRENGKIYNTALLFDREGNVVEHYDKVHLFDVLDCDEEDKESYMVEAGDHICIYDTDFGKVGVIICYDIRFPELTRTLALRGVEYLMVPAAFYTPRFDHWTDLLRNLALHNSMYVCGVNLVGELDEKNLFCGRSIISDPWGVQIAAASDKPGFIQAYVDPEYPSAIREAVGNLRNRRPDMYDIR